MKASINRAVLEQTSFDSAQPSGAATLVHRFERDGQYAVALTGVGDHVVETRTIFVEASGSDPSKPPVPRPIRDPQLQLLPDSVAIDLTGTARLPGRPAPPPAPPIVMLGTGGYAAFSAPAGKAHRVVVTRIEPSGEQEKEFDSSSMGSNDVFAVTLFRPGTYAARNTLGNSEGRVVVTFPEVGSEPYRPADPVEVECSESGFKPDAVKIGPGQGIIFRAAAQCRITVDLVEPDDGPGEGRRQPLASRRRHPLLAQADGSTGEQTPRPRAPVRFKGKP